MMATFKVKVVRKLAEAEGICSIELAASDGVFLPVSCEQGICGTCITRVLEGVPEYRDSYFTEEKKAANDQFTPCCSRAKSACLVLDL
jgi:vanillate O-demethylase ferredoxin subunit